MFKHLLIPLDGSELAEAVLPAAGDLAARAGARVTLLHVIERKAPESVHGQHHLRDASEAEEYLREAARHFPAGVEVNRHVHVREVRDVAHSLADHADELGPDLVVMCSHGEGRLRDWLSGTFRNRSCTRAWRRCFCFGKAPAGRWRFRSGGCWRRWTARRSTSRDSRPPNLWPGCAGRR